MLTLLTATLAVSTSDRCWKCLEPRCWLLDLYKSLTNRDASNRKSLRASEPCIMSTRHMVAIEVLAVTKLISPSACLQRHKIGAAQSRLNRWVVRNDLRAREVPWQCGPLRRRLARHGALQCV